jgi:hypothetical protein
METLMLDQPPVRMADGRELVMSAFGPKRTSRPRRGMSAFGGKADIEI